MRLCLVILCFILYNVIQASIPEDVKKSFHRAKSFKALSDDLHIRYVPKSDRHGSHRGHGHRHSHRDPHVRIQAASITGGLRLGKLRFISPQADGTHAENEIQIQESTKNDLAILENLQQGSDTCQLQSVCVPVNITNDDPMIEIYPRCIEISQCVGSCCLLSKSCQPHHVEYKEFQVVRLEYMGNKHFGIKDIINVTMETHTSCSCHSCGKQLCSRSFVLNDECQCECSKQDEYKCEGTWDSSTCTCKCENIECSADKILNEKTCRCQKSRAEDLVQKIESSNTEASQGIRLPNDEDELIDASKLPTLKPVVKKRRGNH